jgi:hypothetical protein
MGYFCYMAQAFFPELGLMSISIRDPKMKEIQNCIDGENGEETDLGLGMLGVSVSSSSGVNNSRLNNYVYDFMCICRRLIDTGPSLSHAFL